MFYDVFCELCQNRGLTPSGAAAKIGFNRASVTVWKNTGKAPKEDLLVRIADYFHVSVDYLLGKEKVPTQMGAHMVDLSDIDFAFYGGYKELDEHDQETIRDMVRLMRERRKQ